MIMEYVSAVDREYEYEGKIYSETDQSIELGDRWGGDLYDLYWIFRKKGYCDERTVYYMSNVAGEYESYEELLAAEFGEYEVEHGK